jgi:hypothetical protein
LMHDGSEPIVFLHIHGHTLITFGKGAHAIVVFVKVGRCRLQPRFLQCENGG